MKTQMKKWTLGLSLGVIGLWVGTSKAKAANPAVLNIDVTVTASLSVNVNGVASSSVTASGWSPTNTKLVSASSATVTNDSTGLTEKWALSTDTTSIDQGTAGSWTLLTSTLSAPGNDQFALQAVFGSTNTTVGGCPSATSGDWNVAASTPISVNPQTYTDSTFADSTLSIGGASANPDNSPNPGDMFANSYRALCWRIDGPTGITQTDEQNIQIIVTAQTY